MSWIKEISYELATGQLKKLYQRVKGPNNNVDNVLSVHSLRPHSLLGHMTLYKNVLHNSHNTLPKWYLETLGVYVSYLNSCSYCVDHHFGGLTRLLQDKDKSDRILQHVKEENMEASFSGAYLAGIRYAHKLTFSPKDMEEADIQTLRAQGLTDGEILEINQVVSYFNYVNRTVLGLGVNTNGDIIGLSPNNSEDPDNWGHS